MSPIKSPPRFRWWLVLRSPSRRLAVVARLGGIQAQVASAAELALWARVKDVTPSAIQRLLWEERKLVKTWAMRGTLQWFDWVRYSSRQQQEMALGGVVGSWQLNGPADAIAGIWPWLWLGQWLHVGKNATMGLGGYRLTAS